MFVLLSSACHVLAGVNVYLALTTEGETSAAHFGIAVFIYGTGRLVATFAAWRRL